MILVTHVIHLLCQAQQVFGAIVQLYHSRLAWHQSYGFLAPGYPFHTLELDRQHPSEPAAHIKYNYSRVICCKHFRLAIKNFDCPHCPALSSACSSVSLSSWTSLTKTLMTLLKVIGMSPLLTQMIRRTKTSRILTLNPMEVQSKGAATVSMAAETVVQPSAPAHSNHRISNAHPTLTTAATLPIQVQNYLPYISMLINSAVTGFGQSKKAWTPVKSLEILFIFAMQHSQIHATDQSEELGSTVTGYFLHQAQALEVIIDVVEQNHHAKMVPYFNLH